MSTNALANNVPAHLAHLYNEQTGYRDQFGSLDPADIGVNFLKICHGQSREARPAGSLPAIPVGTMFLSRDRTVVPPGSAFIPLLRSVRYIKWRGRPGDGAMEFTTTDKNDPRIVACRGLEWIKDERTNTQLKPLVTTYVNFWIALQTCPEEPVMISFSRTSLPLGRKLTQNLMRSTKGSLPLLAFMFKLETPTEESDSVNIWSHFNLQPSGYTPETALPHAEKLFEAAKALQALSTGNEFSVLDNDNGDDAPEAPAPQHPQSASPANVLNANSSVVNTAPVGPPAQAAAPAPVQRAAAAPAPTVAPQRAAAW